MAGRGRREDHWLVRPATIRGLWVAFMAILAATVVADLLIDHHGDLGIDGTIGFYAWYGLLSCVVLVFGARLLNVFLKRRDRYYGP